MRIGCLQFAPRVGDIDNNLNRADSVLAKANPEDLDTLDLLVLPELAFTGYNFKSLQQISPYLEPSGSGISSLWARTTALKYNTNVVVGYPERVEVSSTWPTGPEHYSSAIIVNGEGETIANYRKSFLYSTDETWALEGKHGFFQGHVCGLGQMAMGICMDLNPYRFEAPWHAFEFGFHILEVRAHLVIITMAWLTREDKMQFSQMPTEPDMETLTYWVQRLEPVIRAEDNEEVLVIFCNRAGVEDDAVYAGTSAVVGIKEGEVHVYGLLGRGSKEVLIVDTDDPPFAKLVHRPGAVANKVDPRINNLRPHDAGKTEIAQSTEAKSATRRFQAFSQNSSKGAPERSARNERPSPRIEIPKQCYRAATSTSHGSPVAESPDISTPTAPSPTPLSARPQLGIQGIRPRGEHIDTPYPQGDGDSVFPTKKTFWFPSQTLLEGPMESRDSDEVNSARPPTTNGHASMRPAPTGSRNSSRPGRHERRASEAGQPDNNTSSGGLGNPGRRTQSSRAREQDRAETQTCDRPKSPKSRNASRSGRPSDMDSPFMGRALHAYRGSIHIGTSGNLLGGHTIRPQSEILMEDQRLANGSAAHSTIGHHQYSISDPDGATLREKDVMKGFDMPNAHTDSAESRTMIWSKISRIVGEHMGHQDSQEAVRGRQRNTSTDIIHDRLDGRGASANLHATPSKSRQRTEAAIRSIKDSPMGPPMGPPMDPDDEIVAEIIFRRPGLPIRSSRSNSTRPSGSPDQATGSTPSRKSSRPGPEDKLHQSDKNKPLSADTTESERIPAALPPSAPLQPQSSGKDLIQTNLLDPLGASEYTSGPEKLSSITSSPRAFDPTTPKAMALAPDFVSLLSTPSGLLSDVMVEPLKAPISDQRVVRAARPRSAVW